MFVPTLRWWPAAFALALAVPADAQDVWRAYQFRDNEEFRYDLKQTENGAVTTGFYLLSVQPAGAGRMQLAIQGKLADTECSGSATVARGSASPYQLSTGCQMLAPVLIGAFMPMSTWFMNRPLVPGDKWDVGHNGESVSFRVNGACKHAGQAGGVDEEPAVTLAAVGDDQAPIRLLLPDGGGRCRQEDIGCLDASAPGVRYVSKDPEACARIRFTCEEGSLGFSNACGCGCVRSEK